MINIHLAEWPLVDLKCLDWTFKYPERGFDLSIDKYIRLFNSGETVNIVTQSGIIFWQIANLITKLDKKLDITFDGPLFRKHFNICYYMTKMEPKTVSKINLDTWGQWPAQLPKRILLGGDLEQSILYKRMKRFTGDFQNIILL